MILNLEMLQQLLLSAFNERGAGRDLGKLFCVKSFVPINVAIVHTIAHTVDTMAIIHLSARGSAA